MHERERHRRILQALSERPLLTLADLAALTDASEATIRRDVTRLAEQKLLTRVRGGVEAVRTPRTELATRSFRESEPVNFEKKRRIAQAAVEQLCRDGETIIINGGTTTYRMVEFLVGRRMQILTNSFPIAAHLLAHSANRIILPGGEVYRDQGIILSPFENDTTRNIFASKLFMGAQGVGPQGLMEADPLLIQAERKLIDQAERLILLVDSSKFRLRGSLILCPLERIDTIVTDDGIDPAAAKMVEQAGIRLIVAPHAQNESTAA